MKFYDRQTELESLKQIEVQSVENACFTVVVGRRRVGKTYLLLKSMEEKQCLYLFVSRQSEALLCERFQQEAEQKLGFHIFGSITRFRDLFEQLMLFSEKEHFTLIIDEFQEFQNINPSIFSEIQDIWDRHKQQTKINFIACGSIYSMMMKIFENEKEPLFGRLTAKMVIKPFEINVLKQILGDYNPTYSAEDLLCLYLLTGGVPKYVELLMDTKAITRKKMIDRVISANSPFLNEGKEMLVSEFGKEYGVYFSIMHLIACGKTTQNEIDSVIGKNTGAYLSNLEKDYMLICRNKPMFAAPNSRKAHWSINDNYLRFWFRFIYPNQMLIEMNRFDLLKEIVENQYEQYSGLLLEKYFREKTAQNERVTFVGNYWDSKGMNKIDMIALNDIEKTAVVAEVKRNPQRINLNNLQRKTETLHHELAKYDVTLKGFSLEDM